MGIEGRDVKADHAGMSKDAATPLLLLPLIVLAIGVGIFAAYALAAVT